jgi:formate hydrogenlyase subunit 3/multisubunit Na+/H+ antiporter MnhD subunit
MGYASIVEAGLLMLALGSRSGEIVNITFLLLLPRGLELAVWAMGLSIIKREAFSLRFHELQGMARKHPLAVMAVILANLSITGFPLLAGFPPRIALWQALSTQSLSVSFWMFVGLLGLLIATVRMLAVFVMADQKTAWAWGESWMQAIMLGVGVIGLFILGLVPQVMLPFLTKLPALFQHLGQ